MTSPGCGSASSLQANAAGAQPVNQPDRGQAACEPRDVPRSGADLFPLVAFQVIANADADAALVRWGHWLGGCNRPFGRQSFGLYVQRFGLVAVAVSASTVNAKCGGYARKDVVELARLCADPAHKWATRVALRLWREVAPRVWPYWPVRAVVSYANAVRHKGDIYRFDGWRKVADVRAGTSGKTWKQPRKAAYEAKSVWAFDVAGATS